MAETAKHIAILCSRLDLPGGIERSVINTADLFIRKCHQVTLLVLDEPADLFYPAHEKTSILRQPLSFGITREGNPVTRKIRLLGDVLKLRKILKEVNADIVIATEYPFAAAAVLSGAVKRAKIYSWEHHHFYELRKNFFWEKVFNLTYPKLHGVICLNEHEKKLFKPMNSKRHVVPNFISGYEKKILRDHDGSSILTIARLTAVKGIDRLMEVALIVLRNHPLLKWKIIGDGEMKGEIIAFIEQNNLQEQLMVQPPQGHDVSHEYFEAGLYVMTSRNECFPMTLLEAMSAGVACIAFDCESGPRHIIENNKNGLLVPEGDIQKMAEAISSLVENEPLRKQLGAAAAESMENYSADKVYAIWDPLLR